MPKRPAPPPLPTDAELRTLQILWDRGPSTVHELRDALANTDIGYTTVLKTLQVMHEKGLVDREPMGRYSRAHVYHAKVPREAMERQIVGDFATRTFGGSVPALVLQALSSTPTTSEEISQIRALLDQLERKQR